MIVDKDKVFLRKLDISKKGTRYIVVGIVTATDENLGEQMFELNNLDIDPIADPRCQRWTNHRVDQILTGELFGIGTTRGEAYSELCRKKREILNRHPLTEKDWAELMKLDKEFERIETGETQQDRDAMRLIHRLADRIKTDKQ